MSENYDMHPDRVAEALTANTGNQLAALRQRFQEFIDADVPAGERTAEFTVDSAAYYRVTPGQWRELMAMAPLAVRALNLAGDADIATAAGPDAAIAMVRDAGHSASVARHAIRQVTREGVSVTGEHLVWKDPDSPGRPGSYHLRRVRFEDELPGLAAPLVSGADDRSAVFELRQLGYDTEQAEFAVGCAIRDGRYALRDHVLTVSGDRRTFEIFASVPVLPALAWAHPEEYDADAAVLELARLGYGENEARNAVADAGRDGRAPLGDHAVFALRGPGSGAFTVLAAKPAAAPGTARRRPVHTGDESCPVRPLHDPCHTGCSEDGRAEAGEILADVLPAWRAQIAGLPALVPEMAMPGLVSARVLADAQAEATRAHAKHGENSMFGERYTSTERFSILAEEGCGEVSEAAVQWALDLLVRNSVLSAEAGQIARELNDDIQADGSNGPGVGEGRPDHLYKELIQTAAMALTWAERVRRLLDDAGGAADQCPHC